MLRAEVDLDHLTHATDYANEEEEEEEANLGDASTGKQPLTDSQKPPVPTRLIITDNEEEFPALTQRRNQEGSEDSDDNVSGGGAYDLRARRRRDHTPSVKERGRYLSLASNLSQASQGFRPRTGIPATPTRRSISGGRSDVYASGPGGALASPLARSYAQARQPLGAAVGSGNSQTDVGAGGAGGASNDDVLAAVKRLEASIAAASGTKGNKGEEGKGAGNESNSKGQAGTDVDVLRELGERQTRIEALLLSLTREMRS